jgi:hypothetical protein
MGSGLEVNAVDLSRSLSGVKTYNWYDSRLSTPTQPAVALGAKSLSQQYWVLRYPHEFSLHPISSKRVR